MRFAAIADIHGNAWALDAVLDDIEQQDVDFTVNLGDVFSGPLDARRTADLLAPLDLLTVRGNHDRYLVEQPRDQMGPSDQIAFDQLGADDIAWLRSLPTQIKIADGIYGVHGTSDDDETHWMYALSTGLNLDPAPLSLMEDRLGTGLAGANLVLCAHTHLQRSVRLSSGCLLVNPGSVGCPAYEDDHPQVYVVETGSPAACYAILEQSAGGWAIDFRQVPYDTRPAVAAAIENGRPGWAHGLETGWYKPASKRLD